MPRQGKTMHPKKNTAKAVAVVTAVLVGVSALSIAQAIAVYDSFFPRYERSDPSLTPGMYVYARYEGRLKRESFFIPSGNNQLCAYYYPVTQPKALAVAVHGMHAGGDDLLPLIDRLVAEGYAVLSYDATATYSSSGEDGIGMCQFIRDLDAVLNYLAESDVYGAIPRVLIGHSLGGNAVASVLSLHQEIKAAVCIAAMTDASTLMVETARMYVHDIAYTVKPVFDVYQKYLFDDYTELNAVRGINDSQIPILLAQGLQDDVIPHDSIAVTAELEKITNPNVSVYYTDGSQGTHTGILQDADALTYRELVSDTLDAMEARKGAALTNAEKKAFYAGVDHRRYSAVNQELVARILDTFRAGLSA
ncbi:MAG: alpha/beta fold hydrolase [Clostridia bacterium]|nr:alpha/beta fold hydrolase [Clostridia bacterium]